MLKSTTECNRMSQSVTEYYRVLQSITEYYTVLQIVTECYRVLQGLQSISSASTWTNFWTCFLFFFSPTSPPYSLSWSQSRFHWQPSIYMWWGGGSYKKRSWSSNCMISTYVQSISFLLSPFQTRESQKVFTDLQQKFSCQYIARDASLFEPVIRVIVPHFFSILLCFYFD